MFQKILIINGNPETGKNKLNEFVHNTKIELLQNGMEVRTFIPKDMNIKHCIGCWNCWWKTPGKCRLKDDVENILREVIKSGSRDKVILDKLIGIYLIPKFILFVIKIIKRTGKMHFYWNMKLKENDAYDKRFDAPLLRN